jgi:hypothetical protein
MAGTSPAMTSLSSVSLWLDCSWMARTTRDMTSGGEGAQA